MLLTIMRLTHAWRSCKATFIIIIVCHKCNTKRNSIEACNTTTVNLIAEGTSAFDAVF